MKTLEQKAKAYDEALEKARIWKDKSGMPKDKQGILDYIFPELAESEDERIRKALINGFNKLDKSAVWYNGITNGQILAWLEKQAEHANFRNKIEVGDKVTRNRDGVLVNLSQLKRVAKPEQKPYGQRQECVDCQFNYAGECKGSCGMKRSGQKPDDKVEPKFHEGEWITNSAVNPAQISSIKDGMYFTHNDTIGSNVESIDKEYHLWTIKDAKEGDVLADNYGIYIFDRFDEYDERCYICSGAYQYSQKVYENEHMLCSVEVHPATKEQRDLLFQKMKEAGYTLDAKKKELKKIEQKPAWSEEDEMIALSIEQIMNCASLLNIVPEKIDKIRAWLKSIKDRIQPQPKPEWSEEDGSRMDNLCHFLEEYGNQYYGHLTLQGTISWLKSLRPHSQWKPSEEQMVALKHAFNDGSIDFADMKILGTLYEQLKALHRYEQDT